MEYKINQYFELLIDFFLRRKNRHLHPYIRNFVRIEMYLLAFLIPFGYWQEAVLGRSIAFYVAVISGLLIILSPGSFIIRKQVSLPLLFIAFTVPSLFVSNEFLPVFISLLGYILLIVLVSSSFNKISYFENIFRAYFYGLVIVSILVLLALWTGFYVGYFWDMPLIEEIWGIPRILGTEKNPNSFAIYYVLGGVLAVHYFSESKFLLHKVIYLFIVALMMVVLFFTYSRASGLAMFLSVLIYLIFKDEFVLKKIIYACFFLLALIFVSYSVSQSDFFTSFEKKVDSYLAYRGSLSTDKPGSLLADKNTSVGSRYEVIKVSLGIWSDNKLFGVGFNQLKSEIALRNIPIKISAHNIFIGILVEYGIFAFLVFVIFIIYLFYKNTYNIMRCGDEHSKKTLVIIVSSFSGFLVNGMFHESYVNVLLWLVIAMMMTVIIRPKEICRQV